MFNDNRRPSPAAESVKTQAEAQLSDAKEKVRDLISQIEESNSKAKARMRDLHHKFPYFPGKPPGRADEKWALAVTNTTEMEMDMGMDKEMEDRQCSEVMRELGYVKKELSKLKLDMATLLEEKNRADQEADASSSTIQSYSSSTEALQKAIEDVNEEQVLVELARMEATKELEAIEAQRREEAYRFRSAMDNTRNKMNEALLEIERGKETQLKLELTTFDVNMLQKELNLVKEMDKRFQRSESLGNNTRASFRKSKESSSPVALQSVMEELEAAKVELASIREGGFQFMASMDVIREELKNVSQETDRLKKTEGKADLKVHNLNSKVLRAKAKLEAESAAEKKAKTIVSNLSLSLEQLKTETGAAKKERELISQETTKLKVEIHTIESEIDLAEEKLQTATQDLEAVKSSEAMALENLKALTENAMKARASASQYSSTITISKFEHEYLIRRAAGAEEVADKKVAAAQAWIEALKASEKEILMKMEMSRGKIEELKVKEEQETNEIERSLAAKRVVERELQNWRENVETKYSESEDVPEGTLPGKSMKENSSFAPQARRVRLRKPASPAVRHMPRSGSYSTVKRRTTVMPNLAKFFNSKNVENGH